MTLNQHGLLARTRRGADLFPTPLVAGPGQTNGAPRRGREETRTLAAEALELSMPLGARLYEVWAIAALGELELGRGDASRAAEHFERQRQLLRELGITDVDLTPQELQIALLLAGGKTTREAAAALFLSPKTIEYHLRHVYLKLGIHSREELARALSGSSPLPEAADVEAGGVIELGR